MASRVASLGNDKEIRIWNAESGDVLSTTSMQTDPTSMGSLLCCSRDGNWLAASRGFSISIWNLKVDDTLELIQTIDSVRIDSCRSYIKSLCLAFNGNHIVAGRRNGYLCKWDVNSSELCWSHNAHNDQAISAVDISFDSALIVSGDWDGLIRLCYAETGEEICRFRKHSDMIKSIQFNPDASKFASCSADRTIRIWDAIHLEEVMVLKEFGSCVNCLSYSYDGTRLVSAADTLVHVWDMESGACVFELLGHRRQVHSVSFSGSESRVIVSGGCDELCILWDSVSGCEIQRVEGMPPGDVCTIPTIVSEYLLK